MGIIVSGKRMGISKYKDSQLPVVLCNQKTIDEQAIVAAGYQRCSLNYPLAKALVSSPEAERITMVRETVLTLIPRRTAVYLVDYEMLFDPRYEIDVLKLFYEISRRQKLVVKWCGRLAAQMLVYAEPGYPEYKQYSIAEYDIICVS